MKVLKIIKCSDPMMWYSGKVGKTVPYLKTIKKEKIHLSLEDAGFVNIVKIEDSKVISK